MDRRSAAPRASPRSLHVWRADLDVAGEDLAGLLCADERERAARIAGARERRRWMSSRGALRALLSRYTGVEPRTLPIVRGESGKPRLAAGGIEFNLSHSQASALFAFSRQEAVGVDVEVPRERRRDFVAIARRTLGADVARRLGELAGEEQQTEFLRAWVRREARLKCLGTGLGAANEDSALPDPWIGELALPGGCVGAIACARGAERRRLLHLGCRGRLDRLFSSARRAAGGLRPRDPCGRSWLYRQSQPSRAAARSAEEP